MLLRIADHLYWLGRYLERMENTARAVEATTRTSLLPTGSFLADLEWECLLAMRESWDDFAARYGSSSSAKIQRFVLIDLENPRSLLSSLRAARENGRAVCRTISPEMWKILNGLWLDLREIDADRLAPGEAGPFLDRVKEGAHLFRGALRSTLLEEDAFRLISLGAFLERADHTARILIARSPALLNETGREPQREAAVWVLRSVGAVAAYQNLYRDIITAAHLIEFLILRDNISASLHACVDRINDLLRPHSRGIGPAALRLAADLHLLLHNDRAALILRHTVYDYLVDFTEALRALGTEIEKGLRSPIYA